MSIKLYNDDCIKVMQKMEDKSVDFILTDIPYNAVNRKSNGLRILDFGKSDILTFDLNEFLEQCLRVCKGSICIFCGKEQFSTIFSFFTKQKGTTRPIVWEKTNPSPMNGKYIYLSGMELAVWFKPRSHKTFNAFCKNTVFRHPLGNSKYNPTGKNLGLFTEILLDNTNENDTVLDPCMGGATTGIACLETNRNFIGIELNKEFFEKAQERIKNTVANKESLEEW